MGEGVESSIAYEQDREWKVWHGWFLRYGYFVVFLGRLSSQVGSKFCSVDVLHIGNEGVFELVCENMEPD